MLSAITTMDNLPAEIIYSIVDKLPSEEIPDLFLVCKRFKDISINIYLKRLQNDSSDSAYEKLLQYTLQQSYKLHLDEEQKKIQRNHLMYEIAACGRTNNITIDDLFESFDELAIMETA